VATPARRLPANVEGQLYVDSTCIDCDTCRWMAPAIFGRASEQSFVQRQPESAAERRDALLALVACPTASIGGPRGAELRAARDAFPIPVDGPVLHCGWHSQRSFGATSYLLTRPPERGGNVLVDSPRFSGALAARLEELGGVATLFLTHADDVADHERFRERFGCRRVLHAADLSAGTRGVERVLEGHEPARLDEDLLAIPTPGHTRGSTCLLASGRYLFTGDHLAWSVRLGHLYAFRGACWYDWDVQRESMERLRGLGFEWVLPGHGRRFHAPAAEMEADLEHCLAWMAGR
jgi:glyoxylase-like metal-dependent hydrolase (beta-lactamase superfamily II)/ferredoxin